MSQQPRRVASADEQRWSEGPPLPRWVLWIMLPGIVGPLLVFGFILISQSAHDETRCPFRERSRRALAPDVVVLEEARTCFRSIEERRFFLLRQGQRRLLGEHRFDQQAFAPERYSWQARVGADGQVFLSVHNQGHGDATFREGTAAEHRLDRAHSE